MKKLTSYESYAATKHQNAGQENYNLERLTVAVNVLLNNMNEFGYLEQSEIA